MSRALRGSRVAFVGLTGALSLFACGDKTSGTSAPVPITAPAGQAGGAPVDGTAPGPPIECGYTFCPLGQNCCNASCGLCVLAGESCPRRTCIGAPPGTTPSVTTIRPCSPASGPHSPTSPQSVTRWTSNGIPDQEVASLHSRVLASSASPKLKARVVTPARIMILDITTFLLRHSLHRKPPVSSHYALRREAASNIRRCAPTFQRYGAGAIQRAVQRRAWHARLTFFSRAYVLRTIV
jgi:hypothetical protein